MSLFPPEGTIAAFASVLPSDEFNVDMPGQTCPSGNAERKSSGPGGTTVKFKEYAATAASIAQPLPSKSTYRSLYGASDGGPNPPVFFWSARVSTARQGVIG